MERLVKLHYDRSVWRAILPGICFALVVFVAAAQAGAPPSLVASVIAGGGGKSQSPGGCIRMVGSMGQPIAGTSANAQFQLRGGFWAVVSPAPRDTLFNSGFEECQ